MNIFRIYLNRKKCLRISFFTLILILLVMITYKRNICQHEQNKLACKECELYCNFTSIKDTGGTTSKKKKYFSVWLKSKRKNNEHLKHVVAAFEAFNYDILDLGNATAPLDEWNVLWSHSYPFRELKSYLLSLQTTHCINHFPGTGFITNKVSLASSGISSIPKSFRVPEDNSRLVQFAKENPDVVYVQKSNHHRGIKVEIIANVKFEDHGSFVQQFIHNPLLVDGYKFDIGIYTAVTSVNPLRVYTFEEVLIRYCKEKYHPFNASDLQKYVVGDSYRPTWEVLSLKHYYNIQKLGMRGSFDAWLTSQNKDSSKVWNSAKEAIRKVFYFNEDNIVSYMNKYSPRLKFFEVMRFDFVVSEDLDVYLMEANMSPNLSSAHFKENQLLYNQVVFNLLSLIGLGYNHCSPTTSETEYEMRGSLKDLSVFPEHCSIHCREYSDCTSVDCQLCHLCMSSSQARMLREAYLEHTWRGAYRRIIPKPLSKREADTPVDSTNLTSENTLMAEWFRGKCVLDITFCS